MDDIISTVLNGIKKSKKDGSWDYLGFFEYGAKGLYGMEHAAIQFFINSISSILYTGTVVTSLHFDKYRFELEKREKDNYYANNNTEEL